MKRKTMLAWSSGKDSAWALHVLRQDPEIELVGLFTTVNEAFNRVAMHAVRVTLLTRQAENAGLPLDVINIPYPCSNQDYEIRMGAFIEAAKNRGVECMAFGDLFLADVRKYREEKLAGTGISPIFPLWGIPTHELSRRIIDSGLKAVITCVDPKVLPGQLAGKLYDDAFLSEIPETADPCGENGEFHSFAFSGPMFTEELQVKVGEIVEREGFVFADVTLSS